MTKDEEIKLLRETLSSVISSYDRTMTQLGSPAGTVLAMFPEVPEADGIDLSVRSKEWGYCPECGSEEIHYQEGRHKQCANCYQEYFSHIDYSKTVKENLHDLFAKANVNQPQPFTPQIDNDGWIEWRGGGECPVPLETKVAVKFRRGDIDHDDMAGFWTWDHYQRNGDIIAYRVIENDGREG